MKKTFKLSHPKIKVPRLVEAIKYEVKKYIKRERGKALPPHVDFWDFDCRYGDDEATSEVIHLSEINRCISQAEDRTGIVLFRNSCQARHSQQKAQGTADSKF